MEKQTDTIYRLNDNISFRECTLANNSNSLVRGDCTNSYKTDNNYNTYYFCSQNGVHLHCTKHPNIEFKRINDYNYTTLICDKCGKEIKIDFDDTIRECLKALNSEKFKDAQLIRLDDWYIQEIKHKEEIETEYWINCQVKRDKDKDTIIILYVGKKGNSEKVQYFIKPEKMQLTNDHKDLDPSKIISKIEVTLKNRVIIQEYETENTDSTTTP